MKENNKTLMMVAGGLFLASAVGEIIELFLAGQTSISAVLTLIGVAAFAVIGIGLITNKPTLAGVGGCIEIILSLSFTFYMMHMYGEAMQPLPPTLIILRIVYIIQWLLFTIAMFMKNKASFYLCILSVAVVCIARLTQHIHMNINSWVFTLILWVGIVVAGKAVSEWTPVVASVSASTTPKSAPLGDTAERISKLKSLLDSGVITQEEFDNKKKEILG